VLDESRCSVARLDPRIGVPDMVMLLTNAISAAMFTEGAFAILSPFRMPIADVTNDTFQLPTSLQLHCDEV
jgi:hypothetical protein